MIIDSSRQLKMLKTCVFFLCWFCLMIGLIFQTKVQIKDVDYKAFFGNRNLVFDNIPTTWDQSPYFGNGFVGSMIYRDTTKENILKIQLFRTDVQDHRSDSSGWRAYSRPRLLIGFLNIAFKGKIVKGNFVLNLYKADLTGEIETTRGKVSLHHFNQATKDLILTTVECKGDESYSLSFEPAEAKTRCTMFG